MTDPGRDASTPPLPAALSAGHDLRWFVGIEDTCVYPRPSDAFAPLDEHQLTGHDLHWRSDIDRIAGLGVDGLRYGMSWPTVHVAPGRFDWRRLDEVLEEMHARELHVIADLVHYGCPPWLDGSFADSAFVAALTEFAVALVDRYGPAIGSLTPINEPLTTASFCGLRDIWPPGLGSASGWATVTVALAEAAHSVMRHVRAAAPGIPIVHVEASRLFETADPTLDGDLAELVMLDDLSTDLIVGACRPGTPGEAWLTDHGIDPQLLARIVEEAELPDVLGVNYYPDLTPRVLARSGDATVQLTVNRWATGLARAVRHAADRYGLPVMVSETSVEGSEQRRSSWLRAAAAELRELRRDGVDVRGLTWWPLIDFVDWSYIADGACVEEFVTGVIDPATRELVAEPILERDRDGGIAAFARRMGLFTLEDNGLRRTATAAAGVLTALTGRDTAADAPTAARPSPGDASEPSEPTARESASGDASRCWPAGAPGVHDDTTLLDRGWTLTDALGHEAPVTVPGLWEAQGRVDLDGTARYRTHFAVGDPSGYWTVRFGAVMDQARVELNGVEVGRHNLAYTPFEVDASGLIRGWNELVVDVTDHEPASAAHRAVAHGKQGWANHEFPSPPSLYLAYGGIWQPVTLRRHGQVAIRDLRCNLDPDDTIVTVEVHRLAAPGPGPTDCEITVGVDLGGVTRSVSIELRPGERRDVTVSFGDAGLDRWHPEQPILHRCRAAVSISPSSAGVTASRTRASHVPHHVDNARAGVTETDSSEIHVGLRTVEMAHGRMVVNDRPIVMRSALVQGFHHEHLYAEGADEDIEREVRSAQQLGFNMLRLHLRPFDPRYLAACDRLGMLLHCDVPIAEPIAHDELDDIGPVARHCADAVAAQVRRDRSHPAIVLWSCMNEIGIERPSLRRTPRYERFVRRMVDTLRAEDDTRPFIENDWIDPDTQRVFTAPLATAHWYGHLSRSYLETLRARCDQLHRESLPVAVTELGDWGLPDPKTGTGRFYEHATAYEQMLADTFWPSSLAEFSAATQGYMGVADRLQIDTIRACGSTAGYCVTELTDVPWEFNGVLDVERNVKAHAAEHLVTANQTVSPILAFGDFGATAGQPFTADAWIVNDSDTSLKLEVRAVLEGRVARLGRHIADAHSVTGLGRVEIGSGSMPGSTEVILEARDLVGGRLFRSSYPVVVHGDLPADAIAVQAAGPAAARLIAATPWLTEGARRLTEGARPVMIVGEDQLSDVRDQLARYLAKGAVAVVLAQHPSGGDTYPGTGGLLPIRTEWGGTPFRYTTDTPVIGSFPPRAVLHVHDADIAPDAILVPAAPVTGAAVGVFKPPPRPAAGLVLGALEVGGGTLIACQYRLQAALAAGSATAEAVLADIVSWANELSHEHESCATA